MPGHFSAIIDMLHCLMFIDPAKVVLEQLRLNTDPLKMTSVKNEEWHDGICVKQIQSF